MAITNDNVPRNVATLNFADPYPGIEARPLQKTDFVHIKPKNPMVSLRFVNRVSGDGQRLDQMVYAGFVPVKPEDVLMEDGRPVEPSMVRDGKVIFGDLICMKIDRKIYEGALKHNWKRAVDRLHPSAQLKEGRKQLNNVMSEAHEPAALKSKIQAFRPTSGEIEKMEKEDGDKT